MENIRYHSVIPTNDRPGVFNADNQITSGGFGDSDLIDFEFEVPGRSLVRNSVEISADITFLNSGAPIDTAATDAGQVSIDHNAGAHAVFESFSTSSVQQGNLENIGTAYPRFAAVMLAGENNRVDIPALSKLLEWRTPDDAISGTFCRKRKQEGNGATVSERQRFNIKPRIMVNRTSGDIPFSKTGRMRISTNLTTPNRLFQNQLTAAQRDNGFRLANVRLNFRTVPEVKASGPLTAMKVVPLKTTISSSLANLSVNIPSPAATGITMCFQNAANENLGGANCSKLEYINVSSVQYMFNSANSYLSYKIDDKAEMIKRTIASFSADGADGKYQISPEDLAAKRNFMLGSDLDGVMDLRSNTFDIQIQSDINGISHNVYLFCHTLASL